MVELEQSFSGGINKEALHDALKKHYESDPRYSSAQHVSHETSLVCNSLFRSLVPEMIIDEILPNGHTRSKLTPEAVQKILNTDSPTAAIKKGWLRKGGRLKGNRWQVLRGVLAELAGSTGMR